MGILRSEIMRHGTLVLPVDRAREFVDLIGASTKMQFEDMNAREMVRPYKKHVQRLDEMERILRFLGEELSRVPNIAVVKNNVDSFLQNSGDYKLDEVEGRLKQMYQQFVQFKENNTKLTGRRNAALEERYLVQTAMAAMAGIPSARTGGSGLERGLLEEEGGGRRGALETMFSNVAGVIPQADQDRFARALFRATRGNTFTHFEQIPEAMTDPKTGQEVHKSVFVIYFQDQRTGSVASAMSEKITKICTAFGVNTYSWPANREMAQQMKSALQAQVDDQDRLLKAHDNYVLTEAAILLAPTRPGGNSLVEEWRLFCKKEKSIYTTLNLFDGHMNLRADCWYPAAEEEHIKALLAEHSSATSGQSGAMLFSDKVMPRRSPPTYIRKNEFTVVFQDLVDTYGLPAYGEANPALLAVVTFPFLFGVMYGDVGHGTLLLAVGIFAVMKADILKYSVPDLYYARYILLMMGIFAVYIGFLYNDFFAIGFSFFTSRWVAPSGEAASGGTVEYQPAPWFDTRNQGGTGPYPFGVDPAWHGAQNELIFMNSMKMKLSVLLGVIQMTVGLVLRFSNAIYNRSVTDFVCECIPMLIFMVCFFGFMDFMILYKWVNPIDNPPSIINSLIAMAMWTNDTNPMFGASLPKKLMALTMLCVPWMLIPKPIIKAIQHGKSGAKHGEHVPLVDEESAGAAIAEEEEEEFNIGEEVIHQVIETIEYVLGTVSHTASYLRLWALSLAHQQLSVVFLKYTILSGLASPFPVNAISIFCFFAVWFMITLGILLGMDVMECFLHVLRLHWVEFQSKFYKASGYAFVPFCHKEHLQKADD